MLIETVIEYICPVLIVMWISFGLARMTGMNAESSHAAKGTVLCFALTAALFPVQGLSLSDYILSVNPNFSIGSIALLVIILSRSALDRNLLKRGHLVTLVLWNIGVSLLVFIPALGFTSLDIYHSGYGSHEVFVLMAVITIFLIIKGSPLLYIFIAYIVAFNLKLLPSDNFFDYVTDGMLLLFSLGVLISLPLAASKDG